MVALAAADALSTSSLTIEAIFDWTGWVRDRDRVAYILYVLALVFSFDCYARQAACVNPGEPGARFCFFSYRPSVRQSRKAKARARKIRPKGGGVVKTPNPIAR